LGKATNLPDNTRIPATNNEATPAHAVHEEDVINIQLPYDPNALTDPELWSGTFHPISLHGSMEHIASDTSNIKGSLNFMAKYIQGKQLSSNKANDFSDLDSMGDAIWNFISAVYESLYILTRKLTRLGAKSRPNSRLASPLPLEIPGRTFLNRRLSLSTRLRPFLPFLQNPRRR